MHLIISKCCQQPCLAPFVTNVSSRNVSQNVTARHKIGDVLYYTAHRLDGDAFGGAAGLETPTALKYLHALKSQKNGSVKAF